MCRQSIYSEKESSKTYAGDGSKKSPMREKRQAEQREQKDSSAERNPVRQRVSRETIQKSAEKNPVRS